MLSLLKFSEHPSSPHVTIGENLNSRNVSVVLTWNPEFGVSYDVTITHPEGAIHPVSNTTELTLLYNIQYNVRVTASLCGLNHVTNNMLIHYGELVILLD